MGFASLIIDTSVVLAILFEEPDAKILARSIREGPQYRMSVASYLEASLRLGIMTEAQTALDKFVASFAVILEPVTVDQAKIACEAGRRFGKGHHPAALNFGDCFSYALAKATREPLLFKGNDFGQTDIGLAA